MNKLRRLIREMILEQLSVDQTFKLIMAKLTVNNYYKNQLNHKFKKAKQAETVGRFNEDKFHREIIQLINRALNELGSQDGYDIRDLTQSDIVLRVLDELLKRYHEKGQV